MKSLPLFQDLIYPFLPILVLQKLKIGHATMTHLTPPQDWQGSKSGAKEHQEQEQAFVPKHAKK
jgi:hypothetical protein